MAVHAKSSYRNNYTEKVTALTPPKTPTDFVSDLTVFLLENTLIEAI